MFTLTQISGVSLKWIKGTGAVNGAPSLKVEASLHTTRII